MPEFIKRGFSGGVLSPKLHFRSDLKKFDLALGESRNFFVDPVGPAATRPGLEFIDYIQGDAEPVRLVEFAFNRNISNTYAVLFEKDRIRFIQDGAYVLEASKTITASASGTVTVNAHGYAIDDMVKISGRTYIITAVTTNTFSVKTPFNDVPNHTPLNGLSVARVYTLASPYLTADLPYLTFSQYRDTLYIDNVDYVSRKLVRSGATSWALSFSTLTPAVSAPTLATITPTAAGTAGMVYAVTSVDSNGRESPLWRGSMGLHRTSVNFTVTSGSVGLSWIPPATPPAYYNVYRSLVFLQGADAHLGAQLGFIGRSYSNVFTDTNIIADFTRTAPQMSLPVKGGQILTVNVLSGGSGYADGTTVSIAGLPTGVEFLGVPVIVGGVILSVRILNPGYGFGGLLAVTFGNTGGGTGAVANATASPLAGNEPSCSTMVQQRRIRAGTLNYPATLFGSRIGDPDNYYSSQLDLATDPYALTLDNEQLTPIRYMLAYPDGVFVFQESGITQVRGLDDGVLKAGSMKAQVITEEGCARVPPLRIGKEFVFLNAARTAVLALGPSNLPQYFTTKDISIFADHFFVQDNPVQNWTWARAPHQQIWATRLDGSFLSSTYVPEQDVIAWCAHTTRGAVEQVESVLENEADAVYCVVRRRVRGVEKRYIERMAPRIVDTPDDMWAVDCALRTGLVKPAAKITVRDAAEPGYAYTPPAGSVVVLATASVFVVGDIGKIFRLSGGRGVVTQWLSGTEIVVHLDRPIDYDFSDYDYISEKLWESGSWSLNAVFSSVSGLHHLEGLTVQILGDGNVLDEQTVVNGSVSLSQDSSYVVAGLAYSAVLRTLPLTADDRAIEGLRKRPKAVAVRVYQTSDLRLGDGVVEYPLLRAPEDPVVAAPTFFEGIRNVSLSAEFTYDGAVEIKKLGPTHATVLGYVLNTDIGV